MRGRLGARDGALRDRRDRVVSLRGVNVGGRSKAPPHLPFDAPEAISAREVERRALALFTMARAWGLDVARVPFFWEALEPKPGAWSDPYAERLECLLEAARRAGLGVILDCHQDLYARALGGDGFPAWTLPPGLLDARDDPGPPGRYWFARYELDVRVRRAFDALWSPHSRAWAGLISMWEWLLDRLGAHPALIGLEIMNEPHPASVPLASFHNDVWAPRLERAYRDWSEAYPDLLLLYPTTGLESFAPPAAYPLPAVPNLVLAPHLYDPGTLLWTSAGPVLEGSALIARWSEVARRAGVPVVVTEIGVGRGARGGPAWLGRALDEAATRGVGAIVWELSASDTIWNGESMSLIDASGSPQPEARALARPRLSRASGEVRLCAWEEDTLALSWGSHGAPCAISIPEGWRLEELILGAKTSAQSVAQALIAWAPYGERGDLRAHFSRRSGWGGGGAL